MGTYELWRMTMYGVGVFVTCNVGGVALRMAWRRVATAAGRPLIRPTELSDAAPDAAAPDGWSPQSLADMRRQYEPDADAAPAETREISPMEARELSPALQDALTRWIMSREQAEGGDWPQSARSSLAEEFRENAREYGAEAVVELVETALRDKTRKLLPWDWLETWRRTRTAAQA